MRVLLIEDDYRTASFITKGLKQAGYVVDHVGDGETGLHHLTSEPYDVAVVDWMLPKLDGIQLIEQARAAGSEVPVLILSAKASVNDRVAGLQVGGDDYLVKPFAFSELLARIQALLRRGGSQQESNLLKVGGMTVDRERRKVMRDGQTLSLQPLEYALVEYLARHAGQLVSKTMIMEHVWDYNFDPQTNVVESRVCRLREKIDRPFSQPLLHTVRGVGYVLEARDEQCDVKGGIGVEKVRK